MAESPSKLRPIKRIGFPIYRRDLWFHLFLILPLLILLTINTWSSWHPDSTEILSRHAGFTFLNEQSVYVGSMLDAAQKIPKGVPLLHPTSAVDVLLLEPLLESNNSFLIVCACWVLGFIGLAITLLLPSWSTAYKFWAFYKDAASLEAADVLLVTDGQGKSHFCAIREGSRYKVKPDGSMDRTMIVKGPIIEYKSKLRLISTAEKHPEVSRKYTTVGLFKEPLVLLSPQYDVNMSFNHYLESQGLSTMVETTYAERVFGKNKQEIPIPEFLELFMEHAVQPLFVFQVFCMLLWLLDEYWQFSMMTLGILVMFEGQMVMRRRRDLVQIKSMHMPPSPVLVKRLGKWYKISSVDLLPGDIFSLAMNKDLSKSCNIPVWPGGSKIPNTRFSGEEQSIGVPCDALILRGSSVVNEAMLTGESLPQMKSSLQSVVTDEMKESNITYDMVNKHKVHTLYAGTCVLAETADAADEEVGGAVLYCLRTGFQTTQGKLIRTVLYSAEHSTVSSREAMLFLLILTVVAVIASGYVLLESWGLPNRNHYKLLLHCVMIITSVVPPELPVTMSLTVTTAVNGLFLKKLYCTEPFRIPAAGKLTYCCFDKTGTLTTSDVLLEQIITMDRKVINPKSTPPSKDLLNEGQALVMGCCNSLVAIKKRSRLPAHMRVADGKKVEDDVHIVGDPLEKTAAEYVNWQPELGRQDRFVNDQRPKCHVEVIKRFPFASELQRMTCVVSMKGEKGAKHYVVCKGAAERLGGMCRNVPNWFNDEVNDLALKGRRVLAMAFKEVLESDLNALLASRDEIEKDLALAGLLVYGCPIKYKTVETIKILRDSGHAAVMITGDDYRTAAHIAKEVGMINQDTVLWTIEIVKDDKVLTLKQLGLRSETKSIELADITSFLKERTNGLVVTGQNLDQLTEHAKNQVIPICNVFARVNPSQKETILRTLKSLQETTLMCGDGTNDVGALKAADVGVSLLNFDLEKIKERKKEKQKLLQADPAGDRCSKLVIESPEVSRKRRLALGLNARQIQQLELMESNFEKQRQKLEMLPPWWKNRTIPPLYQQIVNAEERMAQNNLAAAAGGKTPQAGGPLASFFGAPGAGGASQMMDDFDDLQPLIRPGDASMASPFSYRGQSIKCVKLLIRTGRATLATVMMNYRLMALNSLTSAFSLSVLTLRGVKFGDSQATAESLFVSVLYMCVGNAAAAKTITPDRVVDSLFDPHFYVSIVLQAAVHIITCGIAWWLAIKFENPDEVKQMDGPFKPNLVNTTIFLMNSVQHASTFIANYEGAPFLRSWKEFKILSRTLVAFVVATFFIATECSPSLNSLLKLVPLPSPTFRYTLLVLMLIDLVTASGVGILCTQWGRKSKIFEFMRTAIFTDKIVAVHCIIALYAACLIIISFVAPLVRRALRPDHTGPDIVWGPLATRQPDTEGGPRDAVRVNYYIFYAFAAVLALIVIISQIFTCLKHDFLDPEVPDQIRSIAADLGDPLPLVSMSHLQEEEEDLSGTMRSRSRHYDSAS